MTELVVTGADTQLLRDALVSLATDSGLHPLVPYFTQFVADEVQILSKCSACQSWADHLCCRNFHKQLNFINGPAHKFLHLLRLVSFVSVCSRDAVHLVCTKSCLNEQENHLIILSLLFHWLHVFCRLHGVLMISHYYSHWWGLCKACYWILIYTSSLM